MYPLNLSVSGKPNNDLQPAANLKLTKDQVPQEKIRNIKMIIIIIRSIFPL
jgi:hypothetical protein